MACSPSCTTDSLFRYFRFLDLLFQVGFSRTSLA
jgi:hypothetical protein